MVIQKSVDSQYLKKDIYFISCLCNRSGYMIVLFEGQLVSDKLSYHKGFRDINDERMRELRDQERQFIDIRSGLTGIFKESSFSERPSRVSNPVVRDPWSSKPSTNPLQNLPDASSVKNNVLDKAKKSLFSMVDSPTIDWSPALTILFYLSLVIVLLAMIFNWHKSSLLPLITSMIFCTWFYLKDQYSKVISPLILVIGFGLSFLFDLLWLILVSTKLWRGEVEVHLGLLNGWDKFTVIIGYLLTIFEFIALLICGFLFKNGLAKPGTSVSQKLTFKPRL